MDTDNLVLFLVRECYYKLQCQRRPLFLWDLAIVSTDWSEILAHICSAYFFRVNVPGSCESAFFREVNAGIFSTFLRAIIEEHEFDEHELIVFLFCRIYFHLKWNDGAGSLTFLQRQEILSALKEIKRWVIDLCNTSLELPLKLSFSRDNLQKSMTLFLDSHGLLSPDCSVKLADYLITAAFCQKQIFFVPQNDHAKTVYYSLDPSRRVSKEHVVFEQAVCLPFSFSVDYLNVFGRSLNPGKILLFCCSLDLDITTLKEFIEFLGWVNVSYLASQKVLGATLKEALFDLNIVPLERLSLCHTDAVQYATGATPFHSVDEFISYVKVREHVSEDSNKHLGFVSKAVVSTDKVFLWIYGDKNIATVLIPVRSLAFNKTIVSVCERVYLYARNSIGCANNPFFQGKETCAQFLAEYLHQRYLFSGSCANFFSRLVVVICQTLLYKACDSDLILSSDLIEYTKAVARCAAKKPREPLFVEEQEKSLNLPYNCHHLFCILGVVVDVLDSLSLLLQIG